MLGFICAFIGFCAVCGAVVIAAAVGAEVEKGKRHGLRVGLAMVAALTVAGVVLIYVGGAL